MMICIRKFLVVLIGFFGLCGFFYGLSGWSNIGFSLHNLWFYKNTFGNHPLHISILGLVMIFYSVVDFLILRGVK